MPEAVTVNTKAELDALNQNILVKAPKWTSNEAVTGYASNKSKNPKGWLGTETEDDKKVTASFDKFGYSEAKGEVVNSIVAGDTLLLEGCVVLQYSGALQLGVWGTSRVQKISN